MEYGGFGYCGEKTGGGVKWTVRSVAALSRASASVLLFPRDEVFRSCGDPLARPLLVKAERVPSSQG
jgi:hypothetical protein